VRKVGTSAHEGFFEGIGSHAFAKEPVRAVGAASDGVFFGQRSRIARLALTTAGDLPTEQPTKFNIEPPLGATGDARIGSWLCQNVSAHDARRTSRTNCAW